MQSPINSLSILFNFSTPLVGPPTEEDDVAAALQAEHIKQLFGTGSLLVLPDDDDEESRAIRKARCGTYGWRINPVSGDFFRVVYRCGLWRDGCPACLADRVAEIQKRLNTADAECDWMTSIQLSPSQATKFVRRLRDRDVSYLRYPGEDEDTVVFDYTGVEDLASTEELSPVDGLDLEQLAQTPDGRRVSGKLGQEQVEEEDGVSIQIEQVYAEPGMMSIESCAVEAVDATSDLAPETVEELQEACDERVQAFKDAILRTGGRIIHAQLVWARVSNNSCINWNNTS